MESSSSRLTVEQKYGWKLTGLAQITGTPFAAKMFDWVNFVSDTVPQLIKDADYQISPSLEQLLSQLTNLEKKWKTKLHPQRELDTEMKEVILGLEKLSHHPHPENVLFQKVMEKKPSTTSTTIEQEEQIAILREQAEAQKRAKELIRNEIRQALSFLKPYHESNFHINISDETILEKITELNNTLENIALEQRGPEIRALHATRKFVEAEFEKLVKGTQETLGNQKSDKKHPLTNLLEILSGYLKPGMTTLEYLKEKEVDPALWAVDTLCPYFRGIHSYMTSQSSKPFEDLGLFMDRLKELIQQRVLLKTKEIHPEYEGVLGKIYTYAAGQGIIPKQEVEPASEVRIALARELLKGDLSKFQEQEALLNRAKVLIIAHDYLEMMIERIVKEASNLGLLNEINPENHKQWALDAILKFQAFEKNPSLYILLRQASQEARLEDMHQKVLVSFESIKNNQIKQARIDYDQKLKAFKDRTSAEFHQKQFEYDHSSKSGKAVSALTTIATLGNVDISNMPNRQEYERKISEKEEKLKEIRSEKIKSIRDKPIWKAAKGEGFTTLMLTGKLQVEGIDTRLVDNYIWKLVALQLHSEELLLLEQEFLSPGPKAAEAIMDALDQATVLLEGLSQAKNYLPKKELEEKRAKIQNFVLEWLNIAIVDMTNAASEPMQRQEIEKKFEEALVKMKNGELLSAVRFIQNYIQGSDYGKAIWKSAPSPLEPLKESFETFQAVAPPPKPPKAKDDVYQVLGVKNKDEVWDPGRLDEAIDKEKTEAIQNSLSLATFEFTSYLLGLTGYAHNAQYKRHVESSDQIKLIENWSHIFKDMFEKIKDKKNELEADVLNTPQVQALFSHLESIEKIEEIQAKYDALKRLLDFLDGELLPPENAVKEILEGNIGKASYRPSVRSIKHIVGSYTGKFTWGEALKGLVTLPTIESRQERVERVQVLREGVSHLPDSLLKQKFLEAIDGDCADVIQDRITAFMGDPLAFMKVFEKVADLWCQDDKDLTSIYAEIQVLPPSPAKQGLEVMLRRVLTLNTYHDILQALDDINKGKDNLLKIYQIETLIRVIKALDDSTIKTLLLNDLRPINSGNVAALLPALLAKFKAFSINPKLLIGKKEAQLGVLNQLYQAIKDDNAFEAVAKRLAPLVEGPDWKQAVITKAYQDILGNGEENYETVMQELHEIRNLESSREKFRQLKALWETVNGYTDSPIKKVLMNALSPIVGPQASYFVRERHLNEAIQKLLGSNNLRPTFNTLKAKQKKLSAQDQFAGLAHAATITDAGEVGALIARVCQEVTKEPSEEETQEALREMIGVEALPENSPFHKTIKEALSALSSYENDEVEAIKRDLLNLHKVHNRLEYQVKLAHIDQGIQGLGPSPVQKRLLSAISDLNDAMEYEAIDILLGSTSLNSEVHEDQRLLQIVDSRLSEVKAEFQGANFDTPEAKEALQKEVALSLTGVLIDHASPTFNNAWAFKGIARGFHRLVYEAIELFIKPLSGYLSNELNAFFDEANGTLSQRNLVFIHGASQFASSYNEAVLSIPARLEEQRTHGTDGKAPEEILNRNLTHDTHIMLQEKTPYLGYSPEKLPRYLAYFGIEHVKLPDYCQRIQNLIDKVFNVEPCEYFRTDFLNTPATWMKRAGAFLTYLGLQLVKLLLKLSLASLNYSLQFLGQFSLWKTDQANILLKDLVNQLVGAGISTPSGPVIDLLMVDLLEEALEELKKGPPSSDTAEVTSKDTLVRQALEETLRNVVELLEINDKKDVASIERYGQSNRSEAKLTLEDGKQYGYAQVCKALSEVLVNSSKSLLQKEPMKEILFKILHIANEGMRGGKLAILDSKQKAKLAEKLEKPVEKLTEAEIRNRAKELQDTAAKRIDELIGQIQEVVINPKIDEAVDQAKEKTGAFLPEVRGQILFKYIEFIQKRLFHSTNGAHTRPNIIHFLNEKIGDFNREENVMKQNDILREIHTEYNRFIQEFKEQQAKLDEWPSPNSAELNKLILKELSAPPKELISLGNLTFAIKQLIEKKDNGEECLNLLKRFEGQTAQIPGSLQKIQNAEAGRIMGMRSGLQGIVRANLSHFVAELGEASKGAARNLVKLALPTYTRKIRALATNTNLLEHAIRYSALSILRPDLIHPIAYSK